MSRLPFTNVIGAMERIWYMDGDDKHGDSWLTREDHIDMDAALRHKMRAADPERVNYDHDSGELHDVHELLRRMIVLERKMIRMKSPNATRQTVMALDVVGYGD